MPRQDRRRWNKLPSICQSQPQPSIRQRCSQGSQKLEGHENTPNNYGINTDNYDRKL